MSHHKKLCEWVYNLIRKALTPTHEHDDILIDPGHAVWSKKYFLAKPNQSNNPLRTEIDSYKKDKLMILDP